MTTILIIEDNGDQADMLARLIGQADRSLKTEWRDSLSEGLSRLRQGDIDLTILDLGLPDCKGLATFEAYKQEFSEVPVIIMTGSSEAEWVRLTFKAGVCDYIIKGSPDFPDALIPILKGAIEASYERQKVKETLVEATKAIRTATDGVEHVQEFLKGKADGCD